MLNDSKDARKCDDTWMKNKRFDFGRHLIVVYLLSIEL